jgi:hypothetical protein
VITDSDSYLNLPNDPAFHSTTSVSTQVTVLDAPLHATSVKVPSQVEATPFTDVQVAILTDEDPNGIPADYTVSINWGDGTSPSAGTVVANGKDSNGWAKFKVLARILTLRKLRMFRTVHLTR